MTAVESGVGGVAGIAFVALFVALFVVHPDSGETNREIAAYYEDDANETTELIASALALAAALSLLVFASAVAARLVRAVGQPTVWSHLALAGGAVSAVLLLVGRALSLGIVFAGDEQEFQLEADLARVMESAGFVLILASVTVLSALALAVGVVALRTRTLPPWFAWASVATAVLALAAITFLPIVVVLLWMLAVSVALLRPGGQAENARPSPPPP